MSDYKLFLGVAAIVIGFTGYVPYFRDIFKRTTKPHVFSWFVWGVLTAVAFVAQITEGGGAGSWVTGIDSLVCFVIAGIALAYGEKNITLIDWLSLFGAGAGLALWKFTNSPALAVVLVTLVDIFGFVPTFRKAYVKPYEETAATFAAGGVKFAVALFALESFSVATWAYPAALVVANNALVAMILIRRKHK